MAFYCMFDHQFVSLPPKLMTVVDYQKLNVVKAENVNNVRLRKGLRYQLQGTACDGFTMPVKTYEVVSIIHSYGGELIDGVIVKQVDGAKDLIFTLSKNDCACMGIEYEPGLQIFPRQMSWIPVEKTCEFNPNDLSTMPISPIDGTIRFLAFKLNGFKPYNEKYILTPHGTLLPPQQIRETIKCELKRDLPFNNHFIFPARNIAAKIIRPQCEGICFMNDEILSTQQELYLLADLRIWDSAKSCHEQKEESAFGINPQYVEGINPNEAFEISWDERDAVALKDYETAEKAKAIQAAREEQRAAIRQRCREQQQQMIQRVTEAARQSVRKYNYIIDDKYGYMLRHSNGMRTFGNVDRTFKAIDAKFDEIDRMFSLFK